MTLIMYRSKYYMTTQLSQHSNHPNPPGAINKRVAPHMDSQQELPSPLATFISQANEMAAEVPGTVDLAKYVLALLGDGLHISGNITAA